MAITAPASTPMPCTNASEHPEADRLLRHHVRLPLRALEVALQDAGHGERQAHAEERHAHHQKPQCPSFARYSSVGKDLSRGIAK